ncbi:MAG: sigma-E processing peptidase SpoIIGA [Oscillospiraceae bacterium]|nr:sigma-E processing peptidase SpoIIGA [Oscillospiraceae bacterium]
MQVVYLDSLFVLNTTMDYLLLLASARVAGEPLHRLRMILAALLGGGYAATVFLPGMGFLSGVIYKVSAAVLMVLIGLGASRRLMRQIVIFFALSCAFGGGVLAIALLGGRGLYSARGVLFSGPDIKIVLLTAAICYVGITFFLRKTGKHSISQGEVVTVEVRGNERSISFTALHDTGNTLTDPVSGHGIIVADWDVLVPLFERENGPRRQELADPVRAVQRLNAGWWRGRCGLMPYRAVGVECGMLVTLRPECVLVGGKVHPGVQLALSPTPVSPSGGWRGLVADVV